MNSAFTPTWNSSVQPRKQRKYVYNAPLHTRTHLLSVTLSKDLRTKHKTRNTPIKSGDKVKVLRGQFRGTIGKVTKVSRKDLRIYVESVQLTKSDGSKKPYPVAPSNVMIIELDMSDKRRFNKKTTKTQSTKSQTTKPAPATKQTQTASAKITTATQNPQKQNDQQNKQKSESTTDKKTNNQK